MAPPTTVATKTVTVTDHLGIRRRVVAGTPVPPDLVAAYDEAGGSTGPREPAAGVTIAASTTTVEDPNLGIRRRLIAGQPVPPDLVDAYLADAGADGPPTAQDLEKLKFEVLEAQVTELGAEVTGSGQDGRILKKDLIAAILAHGE